MTLVADLGEPCRILTRQPDTCIGPMLLKRAVRCVVDHRPLADEVEIRTATGCVLSEVEIEALYALAQLLSLEVLARTLIARHDVELDPAAPSSDVA